MNETTMIYSNNRRAPLSNNVWWKFSLLVALFILVYREILSSLVQIWMNRPDYSHGFLIPMISLYFIWTERNKIRTLSIRPALIGGSIVILIGSFMILVGKMGGISLLQQISLIIIIPGFVLMFLGKTYIRKLALPLAYLIFMLPILDIIFDNIRQPFQLFSSVIAAKALNLLDISVFQNGNYLVLPNITLEVARACSGVQYMVSIIAVGIPLAYFTQRNWKCGIILVVCAVIVGIFINPVRITLIALWAANGGEVLHGPLHIFQGLFVSVVGFCALFMLAFIFSKLAPRKPAVTASIAISSHAQETMPANNSKALNTAWIISITILLGLAGYLNFSEPRPVPLISPLKEFPLEIGKWKGRYIHNSTSNFVAHGADSEITIEYVNNSNIKIRMYVGYYESQKRDKKMVDYRLQKLFEHVEMLRIPTGSAVIEVNKVKFNDNNRNLIVLYWYDLNGRIISGNIKAKLMTALDALLNRRANGAIIIVSSELDGADKEKQIIDDEVRFIQDILPDLRRKLSDGKYE